MDCKLMKVAPFIKNYTCWTQYLWKYNPFLLSSWIWIKVATYMPRSEAEPGWHAMRAGAFPIRISSYQFLFVDFDTIYIFHNSVYES